MSERMKLALAKCVFILCCLSLVTITSAARIQDRASLNSLFGTVQDPAGAVIAGAQVELRSQDVTVQTTKTDGTGNFKFSRVPSGTYKIQVKSTGFAAQTIDLKVGPQSPAPLRISMAIDRLTQEATITSTSTETQISPETSQNQNSVSLSTNELKDLPIFDQDYVGTLSRFLDPGATGTSGISLVVDGIEANSVGVSASAIKEVKINNDPYSAEFFRPGRGRIEVTTKPGEPEFHGAFNFTFRDAHPERAGSICRGSTAGAAPHI